MNVKDMFPSSVFEIDLEMYNPYPIQSSTWKYDWTDIRDFLPEHGKQGRSWRGEAL